MQNIKPIILLFLLFIIFSSCKEEFKSQPYSTINNDGAEVIDSNYVINNVFLKGDVRRYGLIPERDTIFNLKASKYAINNILNLAEQGLEIIFPKGHYNTDIIIAGRKNINLTFKDASFSDQIQITEGEDKTPSNNINLRGKLTTYNKFFTRFSTNIKLDTLIIVSDTLKNAFNKKNMGCSIYSGTKNLSITRLDIEYTGGTEDDYFQYTASSLQVHGWNNNPVNIYIKNLSIINADRTALYLTGKGHKIQKATITNFGLGTSKNMFGLEDAAPGEEKEFSGVWLNKCNNCKIDTLIVNSTLNKGDYSLRLDEGNYHEPTFIYNIQLQNKTKDLPIKDDKLTNILVKNEF